MKTIEELLNLSYEELKQYLLKASIEEKRIILSNDNIKKKLICPEKRHDFTYLAQEDDNNIIPLLLDENGIEILVNSDNLFTKLNAILTSGMPYVDKILINKKIQELVLKNIEELQGYLYAINPIGAQKLLQYAIENKKNIIQLISLFPIRSQVYIAENNDFTQEDTLKLILALNKKASQILINKLCNIDIVNNLRISQLFTLSEKNIIFPSSIINNREFIKKISSIKSIKEYRFLIISLEKTNDIDMIEKRREKYYDNIIDSYDKSTEMLLNYSNCYKELINSIILNNKIDYQQISTLLKKNNLTENENEIYAFSLEILSQINDKNKLRDLFTKKSNIELTNIIIDYHFKDVYVNVLKDMNELCNFEKEGANVLNKESINIYSQILNLDNLSYNEKHTLHQKLKTINIQNKFYDDIRKSKDKMFTLLKEKLVNKETLKVNIDTEITNKLGVEVYVYDNTPFYALVKSLNFPKQMILDKENLFSYKDGASFSIDASTKLNTFINPNESYNLVYENYNIDQVVHMYPVDSFSNYDRKTGIATERVQELLMPESFVNKSKDYNEVIISQQSSKEKTDIDDKIPILKPIAIYCYDKITPEDVLTAKNLKIGIMLIKTEKYKKAISQISLNDTISFNSKDINFTYMTSHLQHEPRR